MSLPPLPPEVEDQIFPPEDRRQLEEEIAGFLANAPLYRVHRFTARRGSRLQFGQIKLYCPSPECDRPQIWSASGAVSHEFIINRSFCAVYHSVGFQCRNCQRSTLAIFLLIRIEGTKGELTKVGQHPALWREADPVVVAGWHKEDVTLYRKAMTFRNANEGIAALPYLRRIIENHIRDVLDLIADANARTPIEGFDQTEFNKARTSRHFADKLDFAKKYLPSNLTPTGQPNPMGFLYELISEGLHERSEDECIAIFDRCKAAFEYVIKRLSEAKREDEGYARALRKLNQT